MNSVIEIAKKHQRNYITPEDVTEALGSENPDSKVQRDVLEVLGNITKFGAEDYSLCAFVAWKGHKGD
jgi:hypothetical protein